MTTFAITRELDLPSEKAFAIISDFTRSPSPNISVNVEKKGDPEANGAGIIRTITILFSYQKVYHVSVMLHTFCSNKRGSYMYKTRTYMMHETYNKMSGV